MADNYRCVRCGWYGPESMAVLTPNGVLGCPRCKRRGAGPRRLEKLD